MLLKIFLPFLFIIFLNFNGFTQTVTGCRTGTDGAFIVYTVALPSDPQNSTWYKVYSDVTSYPANYTGFPKSCTITSPAYTGPNCVVKNSSGVIIAGSFVDSSPNRIGIFTGTLTSCNNVPLDDHLWLLVPLTLAGLNFLIRRDNSLS